MTKPGPFDQHVLSPEGRTRVNAVRHGFKALLKVIEEHVPEGRERALVVTNLQQASMWATRGVAEKHNQPEE